MMHRQERRSHRALVDWLRRHDPGDAAALDSAEQTRLRSRMLANLGRPARMNRGLVWGGAALGALILAMIAGRLVVPADGPERAESEPAETSEVQAADWTQPSTREVAVPESTASAATAAVQRPQSVGAGSPQGATRSELRAPSSSPPAGRPSRYPRQAVELRFVAPKGTHIVWMLDPNLDLAATRPTKKGA